MSGIDWFWAHLWQEIFAVVVAAVAAKGYLLTKRAFRTSRRRLEMSAAAALAWQVQVLTDSLLAQEATRDRIQGFYGGGAVGWDIIAANADVPRTQAKPLLARLIESGEGPRFFCITGEPGAGKSTFAWRAAADLHQRGALVLHIKENEPEVWHTLPRLCEGIKERLYVLVDDVFQDPDVEHSIKTAPSAQLSLTILATSRSNEYVKKISSWVEVEDPIQLQQPSKDEKNEVLRRLGKTLDDLSPDQRKRFHAANQFLVLMMELTAGTDLQMIVARTIDRLEIKDDVTYKAYAYLSLAGQVGMSMPSSLIEVLTGAANVQRRPAGQGVIFDDDRPGHLRVGHAVIAECASSYYEHKLPGRGVLRAIAFAVQESNYQHRRCFAHLLRALAKTGSPLARNLDPEVAKKVNLCRETIDQPSERGIWAQYDAHLRQNAVPARNP